MVRKTILAYGAGRGIGAIRLPFTREKARPLKESSLAPIGLHERAEGGRLSTLGSLMMRSVWISAFFLVAASCNHRMPGSDSDAGESASSDDMSESATGDGDGDGDGECPEALTPSTATCGDGNPDRGEACLVFTGELEAVEPGAMFAADGFLEVADLNADQKPDIVAHWRTILGDGAGGAAMSLGAGGNGVTTGDLNGDGNTDLIWFDSFDQGNSRSRVLVRLGGANFPDETPEVALSLEWEAEHVRAGDLDGDGIADLALVQQRGTDDIVQELIWARGLGNGSFDLFEQADEALAKGDAANGIAIGEMTSDEAMELLWRQGSASFYLGGTSGPTPAPALGGDAATQMLSDAILGVDVTCDGFADVVAARQDGGFGIWAQELSGFSFAPTHNSEGAAALRPVGVGDLNRDDVLDVLLIGDDGALLAFGDGPGTYTQPEPLDTPHVWMAARLGDLNRDGGMDIVGLYDDIYDSNAGEVVENAGVEVLLTVP